MSVIPFKQPSPSVVTSQTGGEWTPEVVKLVSNKGLVEQLAKSTPVNEQLCKWADHPRNRPPDAWWDEPDDLFEIADD